MATQGSHREGIRQDREAHATAATEDTPPKDTDNTEKHELADVQAVLREELDGVADELEAAGVGLDEGEASRIDGAALTLNGVAEALNGGAEALATVQEARLYAMA